MGRSESRWGKEDINKTIKILNKIKAEQKTTVRLFDTLIYWAILVVAVIGNFILSIPAILFLFVLDTLQLYATVVIIGVSFGFLIEILIRSLENLERRHHLIFGVIIPFLAIINFFLITLIVDGLKVGNKFNPLSVGIVYGVSFISPYIYFQIKKRKKNRGR